MKTSLLALATLGSGLLSSISAAESAAPEPIASEIAGFAALDVAGESQAGQPQLSLKAIGLIQPSQYQGTAETVRAISITDRQAVWRDNQFNPPGATAATATHYLEVTSGPLRGATFDIVKTNAAKQMLTLGQVLPVKVGPHPEYRIRPHWTLARVFGAADEAGLQAGDETTADLVSIHNGKRYERYFISNGAGGTGWRRVGGGAVDESGHKIYPDDGLAISRRATTSVSTLIMGVVKTDRTLIPVRPGLNVLANVYQVPLTLAESRLYTSDPKTGLRAGATADKADLVKIHSGTGFETFYYQTSTLNGSGWRSANDVHTDAGATVIPVGSAFVIQRRDDTGFKWVAAAPK